jgi:hypothetical protein
MELLKLWKFSVLTRPLQDPTDWPDILASAVGLKSDRLLHGLQGTPQAWLTVLPARQQLASSRLMYVETGTPRTESAQLIRLPKPDIRSMLRMAPQEVPLTGWKSGRKSASLLQV